MCRGEFGRDVVAVEQDETTERFAHPGECFDQFGLPVALNAGNPDDLAEPDIEGHTVDRSVLSVVEHHEVLAPTDTSCRDWTRVDRPQDRPVGRP